MVNGERGITTVKGIIKEIIKMVKSTDLGHGGMIMAKNIKAITIMVKNGEWFEWASNGELVISGFYKSGKKWDGVFKGIEYASGKKISS